ncbi:hypothetical protein HDU91_006828 [Kappamyces sp. JEL0680]|nr:hypothetical protein HDU91_006828 [Kappamyces sp. JEL0680]
MKTAKKTKKKKIPFTDFTLGFSKTQILNQDDDLETTVLTLARILQDGPNELLKGKYKELRRVLYELDKVRKLQGATLDSSLSNRVGAALKDERWSDALVLLAEMREQGQTPKLGCLQRWTRDCDAASSDTANPLMLRVLDSILRTADPSLVGCASLAPTASDHSIRLKPPVYSFDYPQGLHRFELRTDARYLDAFKVVYKEAGPERKPPNAHDMVLYTCPPLTIPCNEPLEKVQKIEIPQLPGVFVLKNVLSVQECMDVLSAAETIGFTPDTPTGGSAEHLTSVLAHNFFWLADEEILERIYSRCVDHLPSSIQGQKIAGLNARWRVYRYSPGSIYRPHIDGSWPGSGLTRDGEYVYDAFGDRWSKLTFLIRLNDAFRGGATTYFTPAFDVGVMDATPVCPQMGDVLVFPHGDTQGSILHEGSPVLESNGEFADAKYVIRTEVLYQIPGHRRKEI